MPVINVLAYGTWKMYRNYFLVLRKFFNLRKNARHASSKISAVLVRPFRAWLAKHSWQKVHDPTRLDRFDLTTHQQKSLSLSFPFHHWHTQHTQYRADGSLAAAEASAIAVPLALAACAYAGCVWVQIAARTRTRTRRALLSFWWRGKTFVAFGWFARCSPPPAAENHHHHHHQQLIHHYHYAAAAAAATASCAQLSFSLGLRCALNCRGWVRNCLSSRAHWTRSLCLSVWVALLLFMCLISCQLAHLLDAVTVKTLIYLQLPPPLSLLATCLICALTLKWAPPRA